MALTADNHVIDPETGFALDRETGRPIGLVPAPIARPSDQTEYPKWVEVHESHIVRENDHIVVPSYPAFHVNRVDGKVTVLVLNEDDERRAMESADGDEDRGELVPDETGTRAEANGDLPAETTAVVVNDPINSENNEPVRVHPYDGAVLTDNKAIEE